MEWAQGLEARNGQLVARLADPDGRQELVAIEELATRGLPELRSTRRQLERVCLSDLRAIACAEYLNAFNLSAAVQGTDDHVVYELRTARRRWVIPALAIVRGIFRPNHLLFGDAFSPHVVERLGIPAAGSASRVNLTAPWCKSTFARNTDPCTVLSWFWRDSDARQMANSVHRCALRGSIDIQLGPAVVDLVIQGAAASRSGTLYASRCTVTKAYVQSNTEVSLDKDAVLHFFGDGDSPFSVAGVADSLFVRRRQDGRVHTTDHEWNILEPVLGKKPQGCAPQADIRAVLDGILLKLAGDVPGWRNLSEFGIPHVTFLYYFRKWAKSDALNSAIEALNEIREQPSTFEAYHAQGVDEGSQTTLLSRPLSELCG